MKLETVFTLVAGAILLLVIYFCILPLMTF